MGSKTPNGRKSAAWPQLHSKAAFLGERSKRLVCQISAQGIKIARVDRSSRA